MKKLGFMILCTSISLLIGGCTPEISIDPPAETVECSAQNFTHLVGQKLTPELTDKIRAQNPVVRVLLPNSIMTLDYNESRINIHTDERDVITQITCG